MKMEVWKELALYMKQADGEGGIQIHTAWLQSPPTLYWIGLYNYL